MNNWKTLKMKVGPLPLEDEMIFPVTIQYKKGYTDILVGHCKEFPGVIVQGKTLDKLKETIAEVFDAYFDAFPEELVKAEKLV